MPKVKAPEALDANTAQRAVGLSGQMLHSIYVGTDRLFGGLMVFQWLAGIVAAILISPETWAGTRSTTHFHVWAAIFLGGAITLIPVMMILTRPGERLTRHVIAVGQMLTSGLLIHLSGGRIESHFHYFGSLAFLSFYRDWHVLITASAVAILDHVLRGAYMPLSIFGVLTIEPWRWVEHAGWIVFEDFFLIISIAQSVKDINQRANQQARLETINSIIEEEVSLRTAELRARENELVKAREVALAGSIAKSEFLSSMSHEIRTPMNAILGMAELLEETPLNADQRKYLEVMTNNGDALIGLINDILDLAKVESGRLSLEAASFDLESVVDKSVETLGVRAHQKGLELLAHVLPDVPLQLSGDPLRLRQILINLIGNAIKFTEKGQVLVTVECDSESKVPGHLHFSVSDTGIGIAKEKFEEVFSSFSQADSSTTRKYGGSGLGLAIVKRLVNMMGGRVWIESELGQGSTFHFTVHLEALPDAGAEKLPVVTVILSGVRALVVDDNFTNRLILRENLSSRGAEVDEAGSGAIALKMIARARRNGCPYKQMLLDCRMPGMDGFEVARRIHETAEKGLTILMLSSDDLKVGIPRARELGLDAYLVKPVRRSDLFGAIAASMAAGDARKQKEKAEAVRDQTTLAGSSSEEKNRQRILLAEDSADNRLLVHAFLKNTSYELEDAENGAIAVEKLKAGKYKLVLMDIQMPVMDGLVATSTIRRWESENGLLRTPIIALTASALDDDVRRTREAGADLHVSKPIKKAVLLAAIQHLVDADSSTTTATKPKHEAA